MYLLVLVGRYNTPLFYHTLIGKGCPTTFLQLLSQKLIVADLCYLPIILLEVCYRLYANFEMMIVGSVRIRS